MARLAELGRAPDLIICDYRLAHGKTGFELIDRLRGEYGAQIPAFLISGDTSPEPLRKAHEEGYYLLYKPVRPITLRSLVRRLLRNEGATSELPDAAPTTRDPVATASQARLPQ